MPKSDGQHQVPVNLSRERAILQELGSANARLLQLERTIKWWSECTATWREKWGRVRVQRNELRDECKVLKGRNEALITEFQKLQNQNEMFWREIERLRLEKRTAVVGPLMETAPQLQQNNNLLNERDFNELLILTEKHDDVITNSNNNTNKESLLKLEQLDSPRDLFLNSDSSSSSKHSTSLPRNYNKSFSFPGFLQDMIFIENLLAGDDLEQLSPCSSTSRGKTDHVTNAIIVEKLSKLKGYVKSCEAYVASKERENESLIESIRQLQESNSNAVRNLEDLKDQQKLNEACGEVKNGASAAEKRIRELHTEIERLQEENCKEWTKREKSETEMTDLKRELRQISQSKSTFHQNKEVKNTKKSAKTSELEDELSKRNEELRNSHSSGRNVLSDELATKSKELLDTKQMYNKARRQLLDKTDELVHEKKRTEHLDGEVKKLRSRIDELKSTVLAAEENIDMKGNEVRRMQRTLEEQVEQIECLQAEIKHATLRFKRQSMILNCQSEESITDDEG